jgi:16S rRNA (uracil1498-N3)-methyltransferase
MNLPFFYIDHPAQLNETVILDEANSRHVSQVLRMEAGEKVNLTDGKGNLHEAEIITPHKKKTELKILQSSTQPATSKASPLPFHDQELSRFEWFLEKAAEIGVKKFSH